MAETKRDEWHLTLSVHRELFDQIVAGVLPIKVGRGRFNVLRDMRGAVAKLEVRQKVRGLLEDRHPPQVITRARERAVSAWQSRREDVHKRIDELLHIEGDWKVQIDQDGSNLRYGHQSVGLEARVRLSAEGTAQIMGEGVELPFALHKFVAASLELGNIHYDRGRRAIVGEVGRPVVDLGEHALLQLASQGLEYALEKQLFRVNPVTILARDQVEGMVTPATESLKLQMGVEDMALEVTDTAITLKARFGFTQRQIDREGEPAQLG
jgi:hypothetical protein